MVKTELCFCKWTLHIYIYIYIYIYITFYIYNIVYIWHIYILYTYAHTQHTHFCARKHKPSCLKVWLKVETCVYHKQSWQTQICSDNHNAVFIIFLLIFDHVMMCFWTITVAVQCDEFKIYDIWFITHIVYFILCKVGLNNQIRSGSVSESYIKTVYCIKYRVNWGTIMFPWCCKRGDGETDGQSDRQMEETGSLNILLLECCITI